MYIHVKHDRIFSSSDVFNITICLWYKWNYWKVLNKEIENEAMYIRKRGCIPVEHDAFLADFFRPRVDEVAVIHDVSLCIKKKTFLPNVFFLKG